LQIVFVLVAFGLAGCVSTQYSEYRGAGTVYGSNYSAGDLWLQRSP
jgi:hypothetical protein